MRRSSRANSALLATRVLPLRRGFHGASPFPVRYQTCCGPGVTVFRTLSSAPASHWLAISSHWRSIYKARQRFSGRASRLARLANLRRRRRCFEVFSTRTRAMRTPLTSLVWCTRGKGGNKMQNACSSKPSPRATTIRRRALSAFQYGIKIAPGRFAQAWGRDRDESSPRFGRYASISLITVPPKSVSFSFRPLCRNHRRF